MLMVAAVKEEKSISHLIVYLQFMHLNYMYRICTKVKTIFS